MVSRSCNSNIIGENNSSFITLNLRNVDFANSRPQIYNFVHQFIELLAVVFYFALFKQQVSEKFLKNTIHIQTFFPDLEYSRFISKAISDHFNFKGTVENTDFQSLLLVFYYYTGVRPIGQDLKINCPTRRTLLEKKLS